MWSSLQQNLSSFVDVLSRKKSLEQSKSTKTDLARCLSTIDLTFIGIGSTIGAGIYVLTGDVAKNTAGPAIVLSFLVAAVASLLSGFCYAEFGGRIPRAGSAYIYCYVTLGELCGFYIGWNMLLEYIIGGASIARGLSQYVDTLAHGEIQKGIIFLIGDMDLPYLSKYFDIFSLVLVLFFTVFLSVGVKDSARLNNFCVVVNILTILVVICAGSVYADFSNWNSFAPYGAGGVFSGAATCFFSFIGFDVIATAGEEARNPARSVPISMTLTIVICFLAYFGVSAVITLMVPYYQLDETAAVANAFHQKGFKVMGHIIGIGATLGLSGCTLISMLPLPRMMYALSQDGMLLKVFSRVNPNTGVPLIATLTSGVLIGVLAMILDLSSLVEMLSIGTLLAYTSVDVCVLVLRYKKMPAQSKDDRNTKTTVIASDEEPLETTSLLKKDNSDISQNYYKNLQIYFSILLAIVISFAESILLHLYSSTFDQHKFVTVALFVLAAIHVGICLFLNCKDQNKEKLPFKVPLVPWLPIVAIFFNAYLMVSLSKETWIRLIVWVVLGTIVYFTYSIFHSAERNKTHKESS